MYALRYRCPWPIARDWSQHWVSSNDSLQYTRSEMIKFLMGSSILFERIKTETVVVYHYPAVNWGYSVPPTPEHSSLVDKRFEKSLSYLCPMLSITELPKQMRNKLCTPVKWFEISKKVEHFELQMMIIEKSVPGGSHNFFRECEVIKWIGQAVISSVCVFRFTFRSRTVHCLDLNTFTLGSGDIP